MRILSFSIIACLIGLSTVFYSDAIPWTSEEDRARSADSIAVGRIISYQDDGAHRYYEISIIKWIKNPQPDQTITMRSIAPEAFNPHFPFVVFQKKDLGLFYLRLIDGKWQSTNYSHQIWASEMSDTIYNMKKLVGNNNPDSAVTLERACKEGYVNAVKNRTGEIACVKPQTLQKLRERGWAEPIIIENTSDSEYAEMKVAQKLLSQNQIEYIPDKLIVTSGPVTGGDPRCGAVIDVNSTIHWFVIDSISKPQKMTLYSENLNQCQVNTASCFCNAQMELTALTLDDLSYFSPEEEERFANILIDYLVKENINRTPKFLIGKFNLNYTDPSAIGYCGELWGYNKNDYFSGGIVNGSVKDYGLERELSPLCAIHKDSKWWDRK